MTGKDHHHGDFAEGQQEGEDERHTGSFAEGQAEEHPHPEEGNHGDFAEGQEASEEHEHEEGTFAQGQTKSDD
jgi:hypothetical protein